MPLLYFVVPLRTDVTERYVSSIQEIIDMVNLGAEARAVGTNLDCIACANTTMAHRPGCAASTNMNEYSSRSHSVFMMTLGQRNKVRRWFLS